MWTEITNEEELTDFMNKTYGFHDSCIKEMKYVSGAYVDENLNMRPVNEKRNLRVIIQRQFKNPSVLELEFIGLNKLALRPSDEKYSCEILDATMILKDNCVYWLDCGGLSESDFDSYDGVLICASKVRWRAVDQYIGNKDAYVYG